MKSLINSSLLIIVSFFALAAGAINNPQIRECRIRGGEFVVVETGSDQVGLCRLGSAFIGARDIMFVINNDGNPKSVEMYASEMKKCDPLGRAQTLVTLEGVAVELCVFNDGSMIALDTLHQGRYSAENSLLNQALGL